MMAAGGWDPVLANQYLADMGAIQSEFPYMAQDLTPSEELDDTEATEKAVQRVRVDRDGVVHYKAHAFVSYAQKAARAPKPVPPGRFDVPAEVGVRDMTAARELWSRHLPAYSGIVSADAAPAREKKGLARVVGDLLQREPPAQPSVVNVHLPPQEMPDVVLKMDAPPINITAQLFQPNETVETETIVDRDVSTGRIQSTSKRTQRTY